jgi:hypothetical protein
VIFQDVVRGADPLLGVSHVGGAISSQDAALGDGDLGREQVCRSAGDPGDAPSP